MKYDPKISYRTSENFVKVGDKIWYECPYCGYGLKTYDFEHIQKAENAYECAECKKIFIVENE